MDFELNLRDVNVINVEIIAIKDKLVDIVITYCNDKKEGI